MRQVVVVFCFCFRSVLLLREASSRSRSSSHSLRVAAASYFLEVRSRQRLLRKNGTYRCAHDRSAPGTAGLTTAAVVLWRRNSTTFHPVQRTPRRVRIPAVTASSGGDVKPTRSGQNTGAGTAKKNAEPPCKRRRPA